MRSRHPIRHSLELLLLTGLLAHAQTADDFFHGGAMGYLSNNIPGALEVVTNGLQRFPDDEKLKKLYDLLNQQQQSQQNQQNQQQQDQNQQDKSDQQKQQQDKNQQQKQSEQQKAQDQQKQQQQQAKSGDKKEQQAQTRPAQMTPEQAQRLLDSQKGSEQVLWFKPEGKPKDPNKPVKDW